MIAPPTPNATSPRRGDQGPDDDAEVGRAGEGEPAQRAGVDAARAALQPVEDLHRRAASARRSSSRPGRRPGRSPPRTPRAQPCRVTVLTSWCTGRVRLHREQLAAPRTEPSSATRPRSLRTRSTIIRFSARSFSLVAQLGGAAPRPRAGVRAARPGALDRLGLDPPVGADAQEALRRGAQHGDSPGSREGRVRRRAGPPQHPVGRPRVDRDRHGAARWSGTARTTRRPRSPPGRPGPGPGRRPGRAAGPARAPRSGDQRAGERPSAVAGPVPASRAAAAVQPGRSSTVDRASSQARPSRWSTASTRSANTSAASGSSARCAAAPPVSAFSS